MIGDNFLFASTVGGATFLGGALGYASKKVVKLVLVIVGLELGFLALLEQQGVLSVNWSNISLWVEEPASDLGPQLADVFVSTGLAGGGFVGGFLLGYRKG